jgi:uncharacterized membrane protein (UPF0182 family)
MRDGDLPVSIDFPREPRTPRRRRRLVILLILFAAVIFGARSVVSYWVDLLWFTSLGYGEVFWKTLSLQWGVCALFAVATFVILFGTFSALKRAHQNDLPRDHKIIFGGQPVNLSVEPVLRVAGWIVSIGGALVTAASMIDDWPVLALWRYAPGGSGAVDPIFGKPLSFFLFTLPAWHLIANWLLTMAVAACLMAAFFLMITGGVRALDKGRMNYGLSPWRGLSIAMAFLLTVLAADVYLDRFDRLFEHHTIFDGINYTDAHLMLTGLLIVCVALLAGAAFAVVNAVRRPRGLWIAGAVVPAALCYVLLGVVGWYVSNFVVKPNELVREEPYIANNIQMTRQAFGLDQFTQREFPAETTVEATEPDKNQLTLQNIRLWDWHALQDTLRQVQEIRTYYDFPDIDIDRYQIGGTMREVMLGTRELKVDKLPESSRNWINEKLIYTHGYGITMNPVNGFTSEGLPLLYLKDMPVQSTVPGLSVTRPQIYFGELTDTDVYVKTKQPEFDYPQGAANSLTTYQGNGGIEVGGFLRRVLLAFDRDDLGKLPFSDDVTPQSRLLMRRRVSDRVAALAPFLTFDQDPYIVLGEDGRLSWVMDAFTTSDSYPYSTHYSLGDSSLNYMRNSVKVVIDAYDGTTTFYVFDDQDPILGAYRRIFPSLFKDAATMPGWLRKHVRYPELLFKLQAEAYGLYHMTNPQVFFNREDMWTVATETRSGDTGDQAKQVMEPNFVLMKLPGETGVEFVEILPFTPANRPNLIGWIAGRCDGDNYGKSMVYDFPKGRVVDGPQQIEARIDQNAQLSGQLTLWNQQGSHVVRGSLLVIPSGRALLYAEPIFLQAQTSAMPELRLVVLALQDKLAYGPTFDAALASLYGGEAPVVTSTSSGEAPQSPSQPTSAGTPRQDDINALIAEAGKDFADYQRLTAEGKLGEAGQKLDQLKVVIDKLNAHRK